MRTRLISTRLGVLCASLLAVAGAACGSVTGTESLGASVSVVSGDAQTVVVGGRRTAPLIVKVLGSDGSPLAGAAMNWSITAGGGALDSADLHADANGLAHAVYLSADTAGSATIRVIAGKGSAEMTVKLVADSVDVLSAASGDGTASLIGYPITLVAKAHDEFGNPIPNVAVSWSATSGILQNQTSTTGENGEATTVVTLGPTPGTYVVTASSPFNTITFTLVGVPAP